MTQTRRKRTCGKAHRRRGVFSCNITALRGVIRSEQSNVPNCIPTLALVVFTCHFDDNRVTRWAVVCT